MIATQLLALHEHPATVRIVPFALFVAVLALRTGLVDLDMAPGWDMRWLYAAQAGLPAACLILFRNRYVELQHAPPSHGAWLTGVTAGLLVFVLWIHATLPWMRLGSSALVFAPLDTDGTLSWPLLLLRLSGAVLVVPLVEELFWRSFLMRWLDRRLFMRHAPRAATVFSIVASSLVFALAHDLWLAGFVAGLVFALLYRRYGNLWVPIVAHTVANLALGAWIVSERQWAFW